MVRFNKFDKVTRKVKNYRIKKCFCKILLILNFFLELLYEVSLCSKVKGYRDESRLKELVKEKVNLEVKHTDGGKLIESKSS